MIDSLAQPGGGERLAVEGAIGLDRDEFDRTLCVSRWNGNLEADPQSRELLKRLQSAGVKVVGLKRRSRLDLLAWRPLVRLLRSGNVDVLHGHLFGSNVWAAMLGRACRVPVVVAHEHMWAYSGGRTRALLDREVVARFSDAFVAVSASGRRQMIEVERIAGEKIVVIPNGIPEMSPGNGPHLRKELGIPPGATLIGSVGHLRPEKAYEVLLEAATELSPEVHVLVAGEGSERAKLERLRSHLGLDRRVHLPGARRDVADVLSALDVAVCCSDFEGGPLSVMEYMAASLPVVATRVGGLPELIIDGETGLLVPPRDPHALARGIERLLGDRVLAHSLAREGAALQAAGHELGAWNRRIASLYRELLNRTTS